MCVGPQHHGQAARGVDTKLHGRKESRLGACFRWGACLRTFQKGSAVVTLARGNGRRAAIMRPSSILDPFSLALGVALLSLHVGEAFLCPTAVLGSSRGSITGAAHKQQPQQQQQRLAGTRWVVAPASILALSRISVRNTFNQHFELLLLLLLRVRLCVLISWIQVQCCCTCCACMLCMRTF